MTLHVEFASEVMKRFLFLSLTTSLGKKLILPTFRLDALVFIALHHFMSTGATEKPPHSLLLFPRRQLYVVCTHKV